MADARFMTGSQSGSVMSDTRTSPACTRFICDTLLTILAVPTPIFWPMLRPVLTMVDRSVSVKR